MATDAQRAVRLFLALAGFFLWAYLMIGGYQLRPTTTIALLFLILAMTGLGGLIGDITGRTNE